MPSYSAPTSCYDTGWYRPFGVSYWQPTWNVSIDPYWSSCSWYRPYGYYSSGYTRTYTTYSAPGGVWQDVTQILGGRLVRLGVQVEF